MTFFSNYRTCWSDKFSCFVLLAIYFISSASHAQDVKRGLGAGNGFLANSVNSRWAYDWNYQSPNAYNGEYVPMFWSGGNLNTKINAINGYSNVNYVLGFNEPERADQANMTVANAINQWRTISQGFAGTGIKLVSPAVSDNAAGRAWLNDFMSQVDADPDLIVDEVAFHWYGTVNINNPAGTANGFLNRVDQYHNNYGRNVWITEFAGLDFGNNYTTAQMNTWNAEFLKVVIPGLEARSYVTRYAWWNHNNDSRLVSTDAYGLFRPTRVGDHYNQTLLSGDLRDMNGNGIGLDMIFLRGGVFVNDGADRGNTVGRLFALAGHNGTATVSDFGGAGDWGMFGWGSVTVAQNARFRKTGTNTVSWRNIDIYNDGIIQTAGGQSNAGSILWIQGAGTNAVGDGVLRLDAGSTLRLGNAIDNTGFAIDYDINHQGGTVVIDGVGVELNGDASMTSNASLEVNRDAVINGAFLGSFSGIAKSGNAKLTLNGENQYFGATNINAGTLAVNGLIKGSGVHVNSSGILAGTGNIATVIVAAGGSAVAPGNSTGTLSASSATFRDQSKLEIEIASAADFDQLLLSGQLTAESGAELELVLLNGFAPSVGDQFNILDFISLTGEFDTSSAPALPTGQWDFSQLNSQGVIGVIDAVSVLLGDCNQDGFVDFADIQTFIEILVAGTFLEEADCNQDGVVDFADIPSFIAILIGS